MRCAVCGEIKEQAAASCPRCGAPASAVSPSVAAAQMPIQSEDETAALRAVAERLRTPARARPEPAYAGFVVRVLAFLIDVAVLAIFTVPLAAAGLVGIKAGLFTIGASAPLGTEETLESLVGIAWLAMAGIYFTVLHRGHGQTIGKAAFGISVRSAATLGAIGTFRSLVRTLGYVVSSTFFGLGFLIVALSRRKRGWHDLLAGTCVVRLAAEEA